MPVNESRRFRAQIQTGHGGTGGSHGDADHIPRILIGQVLMERRDIIVSGLGQSVRFKLRFSR